MLRIALLLQKKPRTNNKVKASSTYRRLYSTLSVNDGTFDTQLHSLIRNCSNVNTLIEAIKQFPRNKVAQMAKTTNINGKLPLDLIKKTRLTDDDKKRVSSFLLDILKVDRFKPLNEPISVSDTLARYYSNSDDLLSDNLQLGCLAANKSREIAKFSTTHPDFNQFPDHTQSLISAKLYDVRNEMLLLQNKPNPFTEVKQLVKLCKKNEVGNCFEHSYLTIDFLKNISKRPQYAYVVAYNNGDHTVVIFGPHPISDPNQYHVKNTQTVLSDSWAGVVGKFYHDDLIQILGDFKRYYNPYDHHIVNVVSTFNPHYHKMSIHTSFKIDGSFMYGRTFFDCKLFKLFAEIPNSLDINDNKKRVDNTVSQKATADSTFEKHEKDVLNYLVFGKAPAPLVNTLEPEIPTLPLEQRLSMDQAKVEIAKLDRDQCKALLSCYRFGLRGDHLRNWQPPRGKHLFMLGHRCALERLILKDNIPPDQAIQRINQITEDQAWDISREIHRRKQGIRPGL